MQNFPIGTPVEVTSSAGRHVGRLSFVSQTINDVQIQTRLAPKGYFHLSGVTTIRRLNVPETLQR